MPSSLAEVPSNALGCLPLPTCGGLRYGHRSPSRRGFSWRYGINEVPRAVAQSSRPPQLNRPPGIFLRRPRLQGQTPHVRWGCSAYPSPSPRRSPRDWWCWNVDQLSIAYALRLGLRSRLTLRRLTFRRNPWAFGAPGFHRGWRYSFRDSHSPALHRAFPHDFSARGTLPYHTRTQRCEYPRFRWRA